MPTLVRGNPELIKPESLYNTVRIANRFNDEILIFSHQNRVQIRAACLSRREPNLADSLLLKKCKETLKNGI